MTDQSSENEFDTNNSLCCSCKYGLCGLKMSIERNEIEGEMFDGPPMPGNDSFPVDEDPALAAHREEYSSAPKNEDLVGGDTISQVSRKHFIHGICTHPMLQENVHVPIVMDCNRWEADPELVDNDEDETPEE